jgi:hypothetical protein
LAQGQNETAAIATLLTSRPLLTFAGCVTVFQLANAAMLPLMASIITMRSSAWATTLVVGSGIGIGASLSTTLAGWMSDRLGSSVAFLGLACIGAAGLVLTALLMPETMERKAGAAAKRPFPH